MKINLTIPVLAYVALTKYTLIIMNNDDRIKNTKRSAEPVENPPPDAEADEEETEQESKKKN